LNRHIATIRHWGEEVEAGLNRGFRLATLSSPPTRSATTVLGVPPAGNRLPPAMLMLHPGQKDLSSPSITPAHQQNVWERGANSNVQVSACPSPPIPS